MKITKKTIAFLCTTILIIFFFFLHTIFYPVKLFDEIIPFKEVYLPICFSFGEMIELISLLGLDQYFEATNTLYSNIVSLRCNPFGNLPLLFIQLIFKNNSVYYHLYSLILHLINSAIVFMLIHKVSSLFAPKVESLKRLFSVTLLTLLWALHPINIESVLLLSNTLAVLAYNLCFIAVFIFLSTTLSKNKSHNLSIIQSVTVFFIFLCAQFTIESPFIIPLVLIGYLIAFNMGSNHEKGVSAIKLSLIKAAPFILAMIIFVLSFTLSNTGINIKKQQSFVLIFERIFWLSPQVLFHFIKLFFLPIKLSVDQSLLVQLGKSLFSPYAIFCFSFIFSCVILSFVSLFRANKKFPFLFLIVFLPLISLIPFSQIPAPLYNLASERYLYFPSFIFIFGISHYFFYLLNKIRNNNLLIFISCLSLLTITYSIRAYIRTLDWKDNISLYYSSIKTASNPLTKALRYKGLTPQDKVYAHHPEEEVDKKYVLLAVKNLKTAIKLLKIEKEKYQSSTPLIIKSYGLDPSSLLAKAGYCLAQTDFKLNNDYKRALDLITPYTKDLNGLECSELSFYGALLYYNGMQDKAEEVLRKALEIFPYSTKIIFPLCELIQLKHGDMNEVERLNLQAFNYFPYDNFTLFKLSELYKLKREPEKYAFFSYVYGLRHHEIAPLIDAERIYLHLNKQDMAEKVRIRREAIELYFRNKLLKK